MSRPPMLAADHVRELVQPYATHEDVTQPAEHSDGVWRPRRTLHTVHHPSLLSQIRAAAGDSSSRSDSDAAAGAAKSKPAAHLEALDTLARIERESRDLAVDLGIEQPARTRTVVPTLPLEDRLLAISGKVGSAPHPRVRSWWAAARLVTHWDSPPLRPHGAPCPACWELDTLRIRLDDELAVCTACGETWDRTGHPDHGSLDLLGQHVRWCTEHDVTKPRHLVLSSAGQLAEDDECAAFREAYRAWRTRTEPVAESVASVPA